MSYYPDAPVRQPESRPSPWKALLRMITEPYATITEFGGRVPIFPAYLTLMVLGLVAGLMLLPLTLQVAEETMINTPGYTPQMAEIGKWSGIGALVIGSLIGPWLAGVITAGFAAFFGQFQEERVPFGSYLGMVGYARLPLALAGLVNSGLGLALGKKAMNLSLSLAVLAPEGSSVALRAFLGTINPFDIWYFIVLAIGFGALHRGKATRGVGLVVSLYVISALLMVGFTSLGAKFVPQM